MGLFLWDSYWGRVGFGSAGLFVVIPVLSSLLGGGYALEGAGVCAVGA
jgi:hypothetical protein